MTRAPSIAVTGGSGCLGRALLQRLVPQARVRALFRRRDETSEHWRRLGCEIELGDLDDRAALAALLRDRNVVYHCAAAMGKDDPGLSHRVNVVGTENVTRAAAAAGVERLVYVSSVSVYGATRRPDNTFTEAIEPQGIDRLNAYARTKYQGELCVRRLGRERGLSYTVVRPTNVYGPLSRPWFLHWEHMLRRVPFALGDLPIDVVYVDDVVDALIRGAESPAGRDEVFNIGHEMVRLNEFILEVARVTGRRARPLPRAADRFVRVTIDRLYRTVTGKHMSLSLVRPTFYPHAKAQQAFGYSPRFALEQGFAAVAEWHRARVARCGGAADFC